MRGQHITRRFKDPLTLSAFTVTGPLPAYSAVFLSTVLIPRGRFHIWNAVVGALCLPYVAPE